MINIVKSSKELMISQTQINKSPAWKLTEIAIEKGKELALKYSVSEKLVLTSLYLSHTIFSTKIGGQIQKNHPALSAKFVKKYLDEWKVNEKDKNIILNSIEAHHNQVPSKSLVAEVVKNAECFKFLTLKGSLILLHEMGIRNMEFDEAKKYVLTKMNQK